MSISQDECERAIFRSRGEFQTDMQSNLAIAKDNGIQIGKTEGRREVARNLLKIGLLVEQIIAATGMTHTGIKDLR